MTRLALIAALLVGCAPRPATPLETGAIADLRDAWHASGRTVPACPALDRLRVHTLPDAELQDRCGARYVSEATGTDYRVGACTIVGQRETYAYVLRGLGPEATRNAVIHEGAHVLRGCWAGSPQSDSYLDRYRTGERDGCHVRTAMDPRHCDAEVWRVIVPTAQGATP